MIRNMLSLGCAIFLALISIACRTQNTDHRKIETPFLSSPATLRTIGPTIAPEAIRTATYTMTSTSTLISNSISQSTPIPDDIEIVILHQTASEWCTTPPQLGSPSFSVENNQSRFGCAISAGHSIGVTIHRFPNPLEAQGAFGDGEALFHCFSARKQESGEYPSKSRIYEWQAERWLIQVRANDDTPWGANLERVSEGIYRLALTHSLFSEC